jgi:GT2 family glycosyltransferase
LEDGVQHVLVWDNSSDEGVSAQLLLNLLSGESRVTIVESEENLGFAAGVNRGLAWLERHYPKAWVLLLNNDAIILRGGIGKLTETLRLYPHAWIAYPDIEHGGRRLGTVFYHRLTGLLTSHPLPGSFPYPSGCCLLIAPERIATPLFNEHFFMYGEDIELGWRLSKLSSGTVAHNPTMLVTHEGSASSGLGSAFYEARMVAAHLLLARALSRSAIGYATLLLGRLPLLAARSIARAIRFRSTVPLRALGGGWRIARGQMTSATLEN